jgi:hypothetical protein
MGNTYRKQSRKFDDEVQSSRGGKHSQHSNNRRSNGIPIINVYDDWTEDDFDELANDIFLHEDDK